MKNSIPKPTHSGGVPSRLAVLPCACQARVHRKHVREHTWEQSPAPTRSAWKASAMLAPTFLRQSHLCAHVSSCLIHVLRPSRLQGVDGMCLGSSDSECWHQAKAVAMLRSIEQLEVGPSCLVASRQIFAPRARHERAAGTP